jgi:phosphate transport system permease protein
MPISAYTRRKIKNHVGTGLAVLSVALAVVPLGAMMIYVLQQGASSVSLNFFTNTYHGAGANSGMANAVVGTFYLIIIACIVGLPVGIFGGIYLARNVHPHFSRVVRFVTDVVAGTPSIIAGVVVYALVVIPFGFSAVAGGMALGLLMFPTVTRATEESIKLVPLAVREAALALGLPEWKTMFRVILPAAIQGLVTAVMLGIARVAGETAPLVFTAFGSPFLPGSVFKPVEGLPLQIWNDAQSPFPDLHQQAWAGALTLFVIVVVLNLAARLLTMRMSKRISNA